MTTTARHGVTETGIFSMKRLRDELGNNRSNTLVLQPQQFKDLRQMDSAMEGELESLAASAQSNECITRLRCGMPLCDTLKNSRILHTLYRNLKNAKHLHLALEPSMGQGFFSEVACALEGTEDFETVELEVPRMAGDDLLLFNCFSDHERLLRLDIKGYHTRNFGLILDALVAIPNLQDLSLKSPLIYGDNGPVESLLTKPSLRVLRLGVLGGLIPRSLSAHLPQSRIEELCLTTSRFFPDICRALAEMTVLKKVSIMYIGTNLRDSPLLGAILRSNVMLQEFECFNIPFDEEDQCRDLADALSSNSVHLRSFTLRSTQFTDALLCDILSGVPSSTHLEHLVLDSNTPQDRWQRVPKMDQLFGHVERLSTSQLRELVLVNLDGNRNEDRRGNPILLPAERAQAYVTSLRRNYFLRSLRIPYLGTFGSHCRLLQTTLLLNSAGRRYLIDRAGPSKVAGVNVLAAVCNDLDCLLTHLLENPRLCD